MKKKVSRNTSRNTRLASARKPRRRTVVSNRADQDTNPSLSSPQENQASLDDIGLLSQESPVEFNPPAKRGRPKNDVVVVLPPRKRGRPPKQHVDITPLIHDMEPVVPITKEKHNHHQELKPLTGPCLLCHKDAGKNEINTGLKEKHSTWICNKCSSIELLTIELLKEIRAKNKLIGTYDFMHRQDDILFVGVRKQTQMTYYVLPFPKT